MTDLSTWHWLGVAVGVVAFLTLLKPVLYFNALLKGQYRRPKYALVGPDEVNADLRQYLEQASSAALALGFTPFAWVREHAFERSEHSVNHWLVLERACGTYAWVGIGTLGKGHRIEFKAELESGFRLLTAHGEAKLQVAAHADAELVDSPSPQVTALWACFADRLAQLSPGRPALRRAPEAMIEAHQQWFDRAIDAWLAACVLQTTDEPDCLELSAKQALRCAFVLNQHMPALFKFQHERAKLQPLDAPLSEEIRFFYRTRESMERRNTRWGWPATLLLSAGLFALSMAFQLDPVSLGMLVLVVLFHELGHYLAMRAFGYRNTSIFFIPFFGAAARGVKRDARLHEEIIVLLAGPLPGIALGVGVRAFAPGLLEHATLRTFVEMLVVVNLVNLLPLTPLDGGRVVQLAISNPRPWFEVGFRLLGALAILALGVMGSSGAPIAVSLLLLATLPSARRMAQAERNVRAQGPLPTQEQQRLELLFGELRTHQPSLPPAQRYAVVLPIVERLKHARPSLLRSLSWSATYVGCLVAGVLALPYIMRRSQPQTGQSATAEALACGDAEGMRARLHRSGMFMLRCSSRPATRVADLGVELADFAALPMNGCLQAPWAAAKDGTAPLSAAQQRARSTVAALQQGWRHVASGNHSAADASSALGSIDHRRDAQLKRAHFAREFAAATDVIIGRHAGDPEFDAEAARSYVAVYLASRETGQALATTWAPLLERMGARDRHCSSQQEAETISVETHKAGFSVWLASDGVSDQLSDLAGFLCEQGCQLRYVAYPYLQDD